MSEPPSTQQPAAETDAAHPYCPQRQSRSLHLSIRGVNYHVRLWGDPSTCSQQRPALVMVHGWMDVAASWQFLVDAMQHDRFIVAPDWRGFGHSRGAAHIDSYWFPDYMADLEALLRAPEVGWPALPHIDLLGHSMGGNVVMMYAGVRPERIRRLINLEGFGLPERPAEHAPTQYAKWLDELATPQEIRPYDSAAGVARRLMKNNPRLSADKAVWLSEQWAQPDPQGQWHILGDPAHKRPNPTLYRVSEVLACWKRIRAPVLSVVGRQTSLAQWWGERYTLDQFQERLKVVPDVRSQWIEDCGHMVHHDQPTVLAGLIEDFLG
ncbi:MAG: alpha/beta hydrolase [Betaproteobacteria bacterium]|jgi:pimeloyl-ACP methyl ester carboxylesterase|nr:alpha/beta hydrolase [Betaproteobacteria bacterium]NBT10222.1 alpha/beta hydrolase [Betaproteobacteria bacterium]NBU48531.1 alpha/beta hydrolase [Betaproteobacteria bacterium]NBX96237.1 alpha/beta hydrolase [Betaproteobacteria bacterium]